MCRRIIQHDTQEKIVKLTKEKQSKKINYRNEENVMTRKQILSLLLIFVMVLSLLPNGTVAMAAGTEGTATQQQGTANENTLPENTDGTEGGEGSVELTEKPTPVGTLVVPATPMSIPNESKANTKQSGDTMETVYTVEFTYGTLTYVLPGGSEVKLSDVLSYVGLSGEVTAASGSNDELFSLTKESGEWVICSYRPFSTEEKLSVTINGIVYEIIVTDTNVSGTINASQLANNDEVILYGDTTLILDADKTIKSIRGNHSLTIQGDKKLTIKSNGHGIDTASLTTNLSGGFIMIESEENGLNIAGNILLNGGMISINAKENGVYSANGDITVNCILETEFGGKYQSNAIVAGIKAGEGTIRSAGTIITKPSSNFNDVNISNGIHITGLWAQNDIEVTDGSVTMSNDGGKWYDGLCAYEGSFKMSGEAKVTIKGNNRALYARAVRAGADVLVHGGTLELETIDRSSAIHASGSVIIEGGLVIAIGSPKTYVYLNGGPGVNSDPLGSVGIRAQGDIRITSGEVYAYGSLYGIYSGSGIEIINGNVHAETSGPYSSNGSMYDMPDVEFSGIHSYRFSIYDGTVEAIGGGVRSDGIYATDAIKVEGGVVKANGSKYGIFTRKAIFDGGDIEALYSPLKDKDFVGIFASSFIDIRSGRIRAHGGETTSAIIGNSITIQPPLVVTVPSGGKVSDNKKLIWDANNNAALYVEIDSLPVFINQPQDGVIRFGEQHHVTWKTSFTPVNIYRFKDGVTDKVFSDPAITSENISEAGVFKYRAWYGTGDDEYVDSDEFKVTKIYRVTLDPNGGTVSPTSMETNADGRLESLPTPTRDQ